MKARKVIIPVLGVAAAAAAVALALLCSGARDAQPQAPDTAFAGYGDILTFVSQGFKSHWEESDPADQGLSPVYRYCSPAGGYCLIDLSGDGVQELLLGDFFEETGDYQVYDIFTQDLVTGEVIHLFCGGERDWCQFNGDLVACETGSNSADDSFQRYYRLVGTRMEVLTDVIVHQDLLIPHFTPFSALP